MNRTAIGENIQDDPLTILASEIWALEVKARQWYR